MTRPSGATAICFAAALCCTAHPAFAQPPEPTILERATDPLRYATGTPPGDPCLYFPCPGPQLLLNRLTGSVLPTRSWAAGDRVRLAVIDLNPFLYRSVLTVEAKPFDPDAPGDFDHRFTVAEMQSQEPSPLVGAAMLPNCDIPEAQRQRLRLTSNRVREARGRMNSWLQDSLVGPRDAVETRAAELAGALHDSRAPARELFEAAWRYRELADVYAPALLRSGLADSTRIVPLDLVNEDFAAEVGEFTDCFDEELTTWKSEARLATGVLATARSYVRSTERFAEGLQAAAREYWLTASRPRSFFIVRDVGGYRAPMNVFVYLHLLPVGTGTPVPSELSAERADMGWTLIFRD